LRNLKPVLPVVSMLGFFLVWQILAMALASRTLPTPVTVFQVLWEQSVSGKLPHHLGITVLRLTVSFAIAMLLGCALGILLGRSETLNALFDNWLIVFLNVPALVIIILCYLWLGLTETAAILAVVINKVPNVVVTIREGARALDRDLLEMSASYRFGKWKTLRHVILPQLSPYLLGATRSGIALIWKIILVVELLGRSNGMGYQLNLYFQLSDVAGILAYSLAFVALIQCLESLVLKPLDVRAQRWRRKP
jgi:NitT/TauT family transport system permease protein